MTTTEKLESGQRDAAATIHDMDDATREVVVDIPHDRVDTFKTSFAADAFRDSFARRRPVMVWQHNREKVIGSAKSAEVLPDVNRLVGGFSDFDAVPLAREVYSNLKDGHIVDFSFFFDNARSRPHPKERGVRQFTKADMIEFSPVVFGSVPGAGMVAIRSEQPSGLAVATPVPSLDALRALYSDGTLNDAGFREAIARYYPDLAPIIIVANPVPLAQRMTELAEATRTSDAELADALVTLSVGSPGPGSRSDVDDDVKDGAVAIHTALGAAAKELEGVDLSTSPPKVRSALSLLTTAHVASSELLETMGEDPDSGDRAVWTSKQMNDLPDSSFAYIEPGGTKDGSGKTIPRDKRHFPIRDADGKADAPHVRNALSRAPQSDFGDKAMPKIKAAAKECGVEVADTREGELNEELLRAKSRLDARMARTV